MGVTIKTFVETAKLLPPNISVLVQGDHGIGKSDITRELAAYFGIKLIDIRLGQKDVGDITGLPAMDAANKTTNWFAADWVRAACEEPCLLFFDEMNRGTTEVLQAVFEAVLDRRLGWKNIFHPQTRVYAAINVDNKYQVNELDPAKRDRFAVFDLQPDVQDWITWGQETGEDGESRVPYEVTEFIRLHQEHLENKGNFEPNKKYGSRRSWTRLGNILRGAKILDTPADDRFYHLATAMVGVTSAQAFQSFVKTMDRKVTADDVVADWKKAKKRLGKNITNETYIGLTDRLCKMYNERTLTRPEVDNLILFAHDANIESFMTLWNAVTQAYTPVLSAGVQDKKEVYEKLGKDVVENLRYYTKGIEKRLRSVIDSGENPEDKIAKAEESDEG